MAGNDYSVDSNAIGHTTSLSVHRRAPRSPGWS
ncbi:hypothetical protein [Mycobacterium sp. IDR2000157661]